MAVRTPYASRQWRAFSRALRALHPECQVEGCDETRDLVADHVAGYGDSTLGFRVLCRRHNAEKSNGAMLVYDSRAERLRV